MLFSCMLWHRVYITIILKNHVIFDWIVTDTPIAYLKNEGID